MYAFLFLTFLLCPFALCFVANDAIADAPAAHPESVDQHFDIAARADRNSVKVKGKFDNATTVRLVKATSAATARLVGATSAATESVDQHFDIAARADRNSVKVKGKFDDATTVRLVEATSAATARLVEATSAATESVAMAAAPFLLSGLGGLAIWRMTGRAKMPSAVCCSLRLLAVDL